MTTVQPRTTASTATLTQPIGASPTALHPDTEMQARVEQDAARIMAAITDPAATFEALAAKYDMRVKDVDPAIFDEDLRDKFYAFYLEEKDGRRLFVIPAGQDPAVSLGALRSLISHQEVTPV